MRSLILIPLVAVLTLAACDDGAETEATAPEAGDSAAPGPDMGAGPAEMDAREPDVSGTDAPDTEVEAPGSGAMDAPPPGDPIGDPMADAPAMDDMPAAPAGTGAVDTADDMADAVTADEQASALAIGFLSLGMDEIGAMCMGDALAAALDGDDLDSAVAVVEAAATAEDAEAQAADAGGPVASAFAEARAACAGTD